MATKKFIIEVEEGVTECNDSCPFREYGEICNKHNWNSNNKFNCDHYNLATMQIKEYNVPDCYDMQCKARIPEFKIELEDKIELEEEK